MREYDLEISKFKALYINREMVQDPSEPVSALPYPLYQDIEPLERFSTLEPTKEASKDDQSFDRNMPTLPASPRDN